MTAVHAIPLGHDVTCIDTGLFRPDMVAVYLVRHGGEAALIETGVTNTVPRVLATLDALGVARESVRYVIPTHVHLDHAGGAGALMQACPRATLVVHPRGARHMIDPAKLWAGSVDVYGEDMLLSTYGRPVPVDAARVHVAEEGSTLDLGGRTFLFIDTPGHARHHFSVWDEASRGFFTGDTFGMSYREMDSERGAFMMPTTSPVQFEHAAWHRSIDRYLSFRPERMYLTHFSMVEHVPPLADALRRGIDDFVLLAQKRLHEEDREARLKGALLDYTLAGLARHGCRVPVPELARMLDSDMTLNAQGLLIGLDAAARP